MRFLKSYLSSEAVCHKTQLTHHGRARPSADLSTGQYLDQTAAACWNLCSGSPAALPPPPNPASSCCDAAATCACGTHTGNYHCLCPQGHFGRGTVGDCTRKERRTD